MSTVRSEGAVGAGCGPRKVVGGASGQIRSLEQVFGANGLVWWVLLAPLAAAAIMRGISGPLIDPDYWWHLTTGHWILGHGHIPVTDPFSYTHGGQNWYAHEWLAEVLFALADKVAGYAGPLLLTAAIMGGLVWLLWRSARYYGAGPRTASLATVVGGAFVVHYVAVRPQVWGFALLALLVHELAAEDTGHRRHLWHVPAIFALWINIHLSALTGGGIFALYVAHRGLRWLSSSGNERALERSRFLRVFGSAAVSAVALCLNPRGPALLWFTRVYLTPGAARYRYISEWQQAPLTGFNAVLLAVGAAVVVLAAVFAIRRRVLWPALAVILLAPLALHESRYIPVFGVIVTPAAAWIMAGARRAAVQVPRMRLPSTFKAAILALTAACAVFGASGGQVRRMPNASASNYPAGAVAWLKANLPDARLFNAYDWGGYLIESTYPHQTVYIDGREEMYGERFLNRYLEAINVKPGWQQTLADSGAGAVLLERTSPLAIALKADSAWTMGYEDGAADVFVPATAKGHETIPPGSDNGKAQ